MKKIWIYLLVIGLFASCGNNEEKPTDNGGEVVSLSPAEMPKSLQDNFKTMVTAFQGKDYEKLDEYVSDKGLYVIYPGAGAYSEFNQYTNMSAVAADESLSETLGFMLQGMASRNSLKGTIEFEDLSEADPCEYAEYGYWADVSGGTSVVSNVYKTLQENMGEEGDAAEFAAIQEVENEIDYKVFVGTGEEADVIYFNEEGGKWYIAVIDLSECGS